MGVEPKQAAEQKGPRSHRDRTRQSGGGSSGIEFETVEHKRQELIPGSKFDVA
jgi:hypothetical protein